MTREIVDNALISYRECLGRCDFLNLEITRNRSILREESRELAEREAVGAQPLSDMPHGTNIGDPTARIGSALANGYYPRDLQELAEETKKMAFEYEEKLTIVRWVEAWMGGLTERERWVIERKVFDGVYWSNLRKEYNTAFNEHYSIEGLRKLKKRILEKVYKMAS